MHNAMFNPREEIRLRMLKEAARLWGGGDVLEPESYDPVLNLLVGACASEVNRVDHEVQEVQNRVFERMVQLLLPEASTIPWPAHAVVQARPVEPACTLRAEDQFFIQRLAGDKAREFFFTPLQPVRLFDAAVAFLAAGRNIWHVNEGGRKTPFAETTFSHSLPASDVWIGLEVNDLIESPEGFHFFFDWRQDPRKQEWLRLLPLTKWFTEEGLEWQSVVGLPGILFENSDNQKIDFQYEFSALKPVEEQVAQLYRQQFCTLRRPAGQQSGRVNRSQCPEAFRQVFRDETLQSLQNTRRDFLWICIRFPQAMPANVVENMICSLNAFPALNRRLHTARFNQLSRLYSMLPLPTDDQFLSVSRVRTANGETLQPAPFEDLNSGVAGTWTFRQGGVERFDRRSANEHLQLLRELLREESAAFAAYDRDLLAADLRELNQRIAAFDQNLNAASNNQPADTTPYLLLRLTQPGDDVTAEYWSTAGELANRIPAAEKFEIHGASPLRRDNVFTLTPTQGGRNRPGPAEKRRIFKEAVLAHGRVVTTEDVRAVCFSLLGDALQKVDVRKGVRLSEDPRCGLLQTVEVALTPRENREDWSEICRSLRLELKARMGGLHPVEVVLNDKNA